MREKINKFREYLDYIEEHYNNVQRAWALINEKCPNSFRFISDDFVWHLINEDVIMHDISKLSTKEFTQYRQYFHPCEGESVNKSEFKKAWNRHKKENQHHWENWTILQKGNPYADAFLVMNIVDWVAMSFKFGGTARDYYESNKGEIKFPDWAIVLMYQIFDYIYPNN